MIIQNPVVDLKDAHDNILKKIRRLFAQKPDFPLKGALMNSSLKHSENWSQSALLPMAVFCSI